MNPAFHARVRERLAAALPAGALAVVRPNEPAPRTGDTFFPFRQASDLLYYSGVREPGVFLVLFPGHPDLARREALFVPVADRKKILWEGEGLPLGEASRISGVPTVLPASDFPAWLREAEALADSVFFSSTATEPSGASCALAKAFAKDFPGKAAGDLAPYSAKLRVRKEPEEIAEIRLAAAATEAAFRKALAAVLPGVTECAAEAEIGAEFRRRGMRHAFPPIVAGGANAAVLHYSANSATLREGELLLLDFGAEAPSGYAADCSRTVPVGGTFSPRQREAYRAVHRVFCAVRSRVRPGETLASLNALSKDLMRRELVGLGLISERDAAAEAGDPKGPAVTRFYPHSVSHFIGLETHDAGGRDLPLEPGMVLTCEPGFYDAAAGIGIRLETDILVTESGGEDLFAGLPETPEEIEETTSHNR